MKKTQEKILKNAIQLFNTKGVSNVRLQDIAKKAGISADDYAAVTRNYIGFQISHRFFYRDILEICSFVPTAKELFEKHIEQVINFIKNGIRLKQELPALIQGEMVGNN